MGRRVCSTNTGAYCRARLKLPFTVIRDIVQQIAADAEAAYLWDDQNIALELDDVGTVEAEYTVVPQAYGNLISQTRSTDSSFYHFDPLGSTRELTDEMETVTDDYRYSVFGEVRSSTDTTVNPYQWVGKEGYYRDAESGLYSLRNRFYGAGEGRFKSEDPLGFDAGDSNLYRYVGNNAATETDPSGLEVTKRLWEGDRRRERGPAPFLIGGRGLANKTNNN